jgi:hypothetical protein
VRVDIIPGFKNFIVGSQLKQFIPMFATPESANHIFETKTKMPEQAAASSSLDKILAK